MQYGITTIGLKGEVRQGSGFFTVRVNILSRVDDLDKAFVGSFFAVLGIMDAYAELERTAYAKPFLNVTLSPFVAFVGVALVACIGSTEFFRKVGAGDAETVIAAVVNAHVVTAVHVAVVALRSRADLELYSRF